MTLELWGTFSVRDHLVPRAFVAEVLLYDRLVIPTLPEQAEVDKWPMAWDLGKQRALLSDLGDIAIPIPWNDIRHKNWELEFSAANAERHRNTREKITDDVGFDVSNAQKLPYDDSPSDLSDENLQYHTTRVILRDEFDEDNDNKFIKRLKLLNKAQPGSSLEVVAAYPSADAASTELVSNNPSANTNKLAPTTVFGWQFFVPESGDSSVDEDRRLLTKAIKLAKDNEFIGARQEFYKWWQDFSESGVSPAEGQSDMEGRIAKYRAIMKKHGWAEAVRYAIKIADAFSGGFGLVKESVSSGAEAFLGTADIIADERERKNRVSGALKVAAMFHQSRAAFGRTPWGLF